jgi:hypothetical protein
VTSRRSDILVVVFLLLVAIVFCGRATFTGRALLPLDMLMLMPPWKARAAEFGYNTVLPQNPLLDPVQQYYPWRTFAVSSLKSGIIPLWNPYSYCGQPFLANLQSALLYPPNLIFLLLPLPLAFTWSAVLHLFLAGFFCYALLRHWRLDILPALLGAVAFMLNGYIIGWLEYPAFGQWVIVWLPAVLLCYDKAVTSGNWRWVLLAAAAVGLQFLGGQLQIATYLMATFFLLVLVRLFCPPEKVSRGRILAMAAVPLLLGLALAAGQLLPTLELAPLSGRLPKTLAQALTFRLPLTHLILYLIPNFFGNPSTYNEWTSLNGRYPINFIETGCYVGIIPLLLGWLAVRRWRRSEVSFLLALLVISLLLALGTPLYAAYFYLVPGAKQLAGLARILSLTAFALAGLAAFGAQRAMEKSPTLGKWELPIFFWFALLAVIAAWGKFLAELQANPPLFENFAWQLLRYLLLLFASGIIVWLMARGQKPEPKAGKKAPNKKPALAPYFALALLLLDIFVFGFRFNPATDPRLAFFPTATTEFLQKQDSSARVTSYRYQSDAPAAALRWMLPNTPLAYNLRDVHGYDSLAPGRTQQLLGSSEWGRQGFLPAPSSSLVNLLGIKYAFTAETIDSTRWQLAQSGEEGNIYENPAALPRAFWVGEAKGMEDTAALAAVKSGDYDLSKAVILSGSSPSEASAPRGAGEIKFIKDNLNDLRLESTSSQPGWLVLTDTAYPGWQATLDGKPAAWQIGDYAFRALPVPAGKHEVVWTFAPATFKVGLFISLFAILILGSGWAGSRPRSAPTSTSKKKHHESQGKKSKTA